MERLLPLGSMSRKLLLASLVGAVSIVGLTLGARSRPSVYSITVSRFLDQPLADEVTRVTGQLVKGSLCLVPEPCEYRFRMKDRWYAARDAGRSGERELEVSYKQCVVPDTFRDIPGLDVEVTVEGERCATCHRFQATSMVARCPSKYEYNRDRLPRSPVPTCARQ